MLFQASTAGYGTRINELPYIRYFEVAPAALAGSALERPFVVDRNGAAPESLDKWLLRFKLYSIDADEMVTVMGLARIKPGRGEFDPHMYQYGGAWLYPLGAWFEALNEIGFLRVGNLASMLDHPDRMNDVYRFGRLFVALAVAIAGIFLFAAIGEVTSPAAALVGEALFFVCPATISFSLTMKPHWYALAFANAALFLLTRAFTRGKVTPASETLTGAMIGLAVGCAVSFGSFAVLSWMALALLVKRGAASWLSLLRVPLFALLTFAASNPFVFLDRAAARGEAAQTAVWFAPALDGASLGAFAWNSLLPGFGIALTAVLAAVSVREIARPTSSGSRLLALGIWAALALAATMTANLATWNVNYRYVAYALPAAILLLTSAKWPLKGPGLVFVVALSLAQSLPLKLAMADENSPIHGTRLAAAAWINSHVPAGTSICVASPTPVPFDTPPLDFARFEINDPDCRFLVRVERPEVGDATPPGFTVAERFRPRLSTPAFALVFGHVNPQITIYRRS